MHSKVVIHKTNHHGKQGVSHIICYLTTPTLKSMILYLGGTVSVDFVAHVMHQGITSIANAVERGFFLERMTFSILSLHRVQGTTGAIELAQVEK